MNTSSIVTIVVAIFASTGFWEFLKEWWKTKNKKKSVEDELLLGIAHDRIHFLCKRYLQQGYLTTDDYDTSRASTNRISRWAATAPARNSLRHARRFR